MFRNVMMVLLAAACVYLAVSRYVENKNWEEAEISPAEYGGLLLLRDLYDAGEYRDKVQPLLRDAFVDGKVTRARLRELGKQLPSVGIRTQSVLERSRTRDRVSRAWDDAKEGAADLGERLGRRMGEAMRDLGDAVEGLKPRRSPEPRYRGEGSVEL